MKITQAQVYGYTLALRDPLPLRNSFISSRIGFLLHLQTDTGLDAWSDAAPLPGFCHESPKKTLEILNACAQRLHGYRLPEEYRELEGAELVPTQHSNCVAFAIEAAYFSLAAKARRLPLYRYLSESALPLVPLNALLAGAPRKILQRAEGLAEKGYATAKLKVGHRTPEDDIALVDSLARITPPHFQLRLDANRAWPLTTALRMSEKLAQHPIEYLEEPVDTPEALLAFSEDSPLPYAVDESFHTFPHQARQHLKKGGPMNPAFQQFIEELTRIFNKAEACIWKPSLIYAPNIGRLLATNTFALPVRKPVLSAAFESGVGIALLANFAAAWCGPAVAVGLDTYDWLSEDVLMERLPMGRGVIDLDEINEAAAHIDYQRLSLLYDSTKK